MQEKSSDNKAKPRKNTWLVKAGEVEIGAGKEVVVQSMCATHTRDVVATLEQIKVLQDHGAGLIRVAVDSKVDVEALAEIRKKTTAALVVDIQESFHLVPLVAPYVQKIRYNPGHLHHMQQGTSVEEKVKFIVDEAKKHNLALRIGINFGSLDPNQKELTKKSYDTALESVREHVHLMEKFSFENYVVSLKSSDPNEVIELNRCFAEEFPYIPLHLGVTEAGMLPIAEAKTRAAFETLLLDGIGDTLRVSLTLPYAEKYKEVEVGKQILADVYSGKAHRHFYQQSGLNIVSCPSCSRVENGDFVHFAARVKEALAFAKDKNITVAVMGCRVNGPGEADNADIGLWCAADHVNMKIHSELIGSFSFDEALERVKEEVAKL